MDKKDNALNASLPEKRKLNSMLSLSKRAGQLVSGESKTENAIKRGKARLIIISFEASGNTRKKFTNSALYYKVPVYIINFTKEELGGIIGESQRSVIAVIGDNFIDDLKICLTKSELGGGPIV